MFLTWVQLKDYITRNDLTIQWNDLTDSYFLQVTNAGLVYQCTLVKDGGSDQIDFETNYKFTSGISPELDSLHDAAFSLSENFTASNQSFEIDCTGLSTMKFQLLGTWVGTIQWDYSIDGTNFNGTFFAINTSTSAFESISSVNGIWTADVTGAKIIRFSSPIRSSGTATLTVNQNQQPVVIEAIIGTVVIDGTVGLQTADEIPLNAGQQTMANSLPIVIASNQSAIPITGSISATNPSVSITGVAIPADATLIGGSDGTNLQPLKVSNTGVLSVDASAHTQPISGTITVNALTNSSIVKSQLQDNSGNALNSTSNALNVSVQNSSLAVTQSGTWTVQPGNTPNTTAWKVDGSAVTQPVSISGNQAVNIAQINGVTTTMGNGISGTGVQRVTLASDSTGQVALAAGSNTIGSLTANQSINNAQVNGNSVVTSVTGIQDVMPRKRTSTTGLSPNYSSTRITSKTTTTVTASTAYLSAIVISCSAAGTSWTMTVQDGEATAKILIPSFTLTVPTTGLPIILQFVEPILMTTGINIVTAGTTAGTVDVFVTYWQ